MAEALVQAMMRAHLKSALDNDTNVSTTLIKQMAAVGKGFPEALASGILSLGNVHGPVMQARQVLFNMENDEIRSAVESGMIVPGFGNHFHKDGVDPAWSEVCELLESDFPEAAKRIEEVADIINEAKGHKLDKKIHPNPAAYTATVAQVLQLPPGTEVSLVVIARMPAWTQQWFESL